MRASFGGRPFPSGRRSDRRIGSNKAHCSSLSSQRPCMGLVSRQIARSSSVSLNLFSSQASFFSSRCQRTIFETTSSVIPNKLFYAGKLSDHPDTQKDQELDEWYNREWGFDKPVLLVDTGPIHAWVTSVPRTVRASRLNFLSATVSVDIAKSVLRGNRKRSPDEDPRVLLVAPYSPHAKLMGLSCREAKLDTEVKHGTVHTFQGREADIVLFDLVNDEPHWRVGMFDPKRDDDMKRLFNVALTRAKRRLIVVGDFEYIQKLSRRLLLAKSSCLFYCPDIR